MQFLRNAAIATLIGASLLMPVAQAQEDESPGFFARTWESMKDLFGSAKEDTKDAAGAVGDVAVEGGRRAANAGKAVGKAFTEGAKDVKEAVTTPSDAGGAKEPDAGQQN